MGSIFGEAVQAYDPAADEEERQRQEKLALPNAGDIPVPAPLPPSPAGGMIGNAFAQPAPEPPTGINPTQGGFRQTELQPDPNALTDNPFALPFGAFNAAREATYIPGVTPFIEDQVKPFVADVVNSPISPLSGVNWASQQLGGPDIGYNVAEQVPSYGLDFGLNALGAKSVPEALLGVPLGEARGAAANFATRGLEGIPPSFDALGGREAAAVQLRGGLLAGAAIDPLSPQAAYDAAYRATPGATADKVLNAEAARQEALSGERLPFPYSAVPQDFGPSAVAKENGLQMENRFGPPSAYDPSLSGGSGYRALDVGVEPQAITPPPSAIPEPAPPDVYGRDYYNDPALAEARLGLPEASSSVSPPPASLTPEEIGNTMRQADIDAGLTPEPATHSQRIDQLISEARTPDLPTMPLSNEEAIKEATRLGVPVDRGVFERGSALARQQEMDLVSAARDLENSIKTTSTESRALDAFVGANKSDAIPGAGGGSRGGGGSADGGLGGGSGGATPPPGRAGGAGQGNLLGTAYRNLQELAYAKFGYDLSAGRQTVGRTLNPFYLPDTVRSIKATTAALGSEATGVRLNDAIKEALEAKGVTPKMADWRVGGELVNREMGVSKFFNWIPGYEALNRGFATMVNFQRYGPMLQMIEKNANLTTAQLQHMADYAAIQTGRGTFGPWDKQIASVLGPVMTSARNAASWPERMAYLIPAQKVGSDWTLFGPTWRAAVKDNGGMIATGLGIMAISEQIGGKANYQTGDISFGDKHYNIWGGGYGWVKMAHDVYTGTKNGKDYPRFFEQDANGKWKGSLAEFFRNKVGPLPQETIALMKETGLDKKIGAENIANFMSPDYWNKGVTGKNLGVLDRAAQFATFLTVQDMAKFAFDKADTSGSTTDAIKSVANLQGLKDAASASPSFFGASVNRYTEGGALGGLRESVKNDPALPEPLKGVDYKDLGPDGKAAVDKLAEQAKPDEYKQGIKERDANSNPVFTKYHEVVNQANQQADQRKTDLYNMLREGKVNGEQLRMGRDVINSSAAKQKDAARNDSDYKKALSELEQNDVNKALSAYYQIGDKAPHLPNGKLDFDWIEQKQSEFLKFAEQKNPETAKLLRFEVDTTKDRTNPLDKLYDLARPMLERYGAIKDDYARSMAQANNPREDAFLALLGYGKTQSPQAAQLLEQMRANLPSANAPVAAGVQRSAVAAPESAPPTQPMVSPLNPNDAAVGPNGRTVAQIAGNPYLSDEERNFYFQSRGLPVPTPGAPTPGRVNDSSAGATGSAYTTNAQGRTPPINGADIAPVAQKYGVPAGPFALLMNHEGNGAHDTSEKGVQPARWGIVETTARQYGISDTRSMTPQQAYDIAGQYLSKGMEANKGDAAKAFASYYIGQGNVEKAVRQGGDWVKNADRIAGGVGDQIGVNYGGHSMTDFLAYLGLR